MAIGVAEVLDNADVLWYNGWLAFVFLGTKVLAIALGICYNIRLAHAFLRVSMPKKPLSAYLLVGKPSEEGLHSGFSARPLTVTVILEHRNHQWKRQKRKALHESPIN